jgi:hypothetical protein
VQGEFNMDLISFLIAFLVIAQLLIVTFLLILWKKYQTSLDTNQNTNEHERIYVEIQALEDRLKEKIDFVVNLLGTQKILIPQLYEKPDGSALANKVQDKGKEESDLGKGEHGQIAPIEVKTPIYANPSQKLLESLLNGHDFLQLTWQDLNGSFKRCSNDLIRFLTENGLPKPDIEPYPLLQDYNWPHWKFLIIQVQDSSASNVRYVIPQNFDKYDPAWHNHLFDIRSATTNPDKHIKELHRCATISSSGAIDGYISKSIVEGRGIISLA